VVGGPTSSSHDVETAAARPNIRDSADRNRRSPHRRPIIERRERAQRDDAVRGHPRRLSRRSDCRRGSRARVNFRGIRDPSFPPPVFSLPFLFLLSCPLSCELEEGAKRQRKSSADTRSAALLLSSINTDCVCGRADSRRSFLENNYTPRPGRSPDNDTARGQDGRGAMKKFDRARQSRDCSIRSASPATARLQKARAASCRRTRYPRRLKNAPCMSTKGAGVPFSFTAVAWRQ